jgi:integrase
MSGSNATRPFKRFKTRHRGITYRETAEGRTYYVYAQGKQHRVEGGGEQEAVAKQAELRGKIAKRQPLLTEKHSFAEAAEAAYVLNRGKWTPRVAEGYRIDLDRHILPHFTGELREYDWESIIEFRLALEAKGLSGHTIRNIFKPLKASFGYAKKKRWIDHNPVNDLERGDGPVTIPREVPIPDAEGIASLFAAVDAFRERGGFDGIREFVELGLYGLRKGEALGLDWSDLDKAHGRVSVSKQWRTDGVITAPKTKAGIRTVQLQPGTLERLERLQRRSGAIGGPIFRTKDGKRLGHRNTFRAWDTIRKEAGLDSLRFHDLRHVADSVLHKDGKVAAEIAETLGHANAHITLTTYTHTITDEAIEAVAQVLS